MMKMVLYILFFLVTLFLFISFTLPGVANSKSAATRHNESHSRAIPKLL